MHIIIDNQTFDFSDKSHISVKGYDLDITEPGFDESSKKFIGGGTSKPIVLPRYIENIISRCHGLEPCSRVYEDNQGKKWLTAYFD